MAAVRGDRSSEQRVPQLRRLNRPPSQWAASIALPAIHTVLCGLASGTMLTSRASSLLPRSARGPPAALAPRLQPHRWQQSHAPCVGPRSGPSAATARRAAGRAAAAGGAQQAPAPPPAPGDGPSPSTSSGSADSGSSHGLRVVLVNPQIPQNTGNVARTCAATGAALHLVGPLGFEISDKQLKRAGLDYWEHGEAACACMHACMRSHAFACMHARPHAVAGVHARQAAPCTCRRQTGSARMPRCCPDHRK